MMCRKDPISQEVHQLSYAEHQKSLQEDELHFWKNDKKPFFRNEEYLRNKKPYIEDIVEQLLKNGQSHIRILDVGSGPRSCLSKLQTQNVSIIAIDPLASDYHKLSAPEWLISPLDITGEDIGKIFPDNYFDIVWCMNALDHSMNPSYVVQQICNTLKANGVFICGTNICEGTRNAFAGLHKYNLVYKDGKLIDELSGFDLSARTDFIVESVPSFNDKWGVFIFRKTVLNV